MSASSNLDLLYIVLSLSILWFTVFLCWLLYQAARVLKNANDIIENLTRKLELIAEGVEYMRRKVDDVSSHMGIVTTLGAKLVEKLVVQKISKKFDTETKTKVKKKSRK